MRTNGWWQMLEIWKLSQDSKTDLQNSEYKYMLVKHSIKSLIFHSAVLK